MKVLKQRFQVTVIEPDVFGDQRGFMKPGMLNDMQRLAWMLILCRIIYLFQLWCLRGLITSSLMLRKLVYVLQGSVYDVAVDIRVGSPSFGQWYGVELSAENKRQFYIPEGFAHGYCVLSETALFAYKCTDFYSPATEGGIAWNDPELGIDWPVENPILSDKDTKYPLLREIDRNKLPQWSEHHG